MAKARNILQRANSVRKIRTVTKTMEMVATARYRQVFKHASNLRPYTEKAIDMVADLIHRRDEDHPLDDPLVVGREDVQRDALVVLTSDRGLCAGYNAAVVRLAEVRRRQLEAEGYAVEVHVIGKQGVSAYRNSDADVVRTAESFGDDPDFHAVGAFADGFMDALAEGRIGGVEAAYTQFVSASVQKPAIAQLLPLESLEPPKRVFAGNEGAEPEPYEFLPSAEVILGQLLPALVRLRMYQCFTDAAVSEQLARMSAMRSATDNADEMIRDLMMKYNRTRQGNITNELAEIVGGSEHLRG